MAQFPEKQLRDFTLSVRLRPDMRERLNFVSEALGVSPATVASMAIGQYVASQHASLTASHKSAESLIQQVAPGMLEMFKTLATESENEPCSSSKASSVQLPLLAAEQTAKQAKSSPKEKSSRSKPSTRAALSK
jgi:hypothetical protein